jgi:hypothetical protein
MRIRRMAISAAFVAGLATLPLSAADAQYYPPCSPVPLFWPFCVAGAVVGTAAIIVTAPIRALTGAPPFGYYPPPPYLPAAATTGTLRLLRRRPDITGHAEPPSRGAGTADFHGWLGICAGLAPRCRALISGCILWPNAHSAPLRDAYTQLVCWFHNREGKREEKCATFSGVS